MESFSLTSTLKSILDKEIIYCNCSSSNLISITFVLLGSAKYTENTYDAKIEINPYYIVLFNVFYLIHFLDTYKNRVQNLHVHFDWKSPQGIVLILLILITIFILRFYNEMYLLLHIK